MLLKLLYFNISMELNILQSFLIVKKSLFQLLLYFISIVFLLLVICPQLSHGRDNKIPVHYAVTGKPLELIYYKYDGRSINFCTWRPANNVPPLNATETNKQELKAGKCILTIKEALKEHFTVWTCDIYYFTPLHGKLDVYSRYQVSVQEAKKPVSPVIEKKSKTVLTSPLNDVSLQNNTIPSIRCCTKGGLPPPQLTIMLDSEVKVEEEKLRSNFCITWFNATFNIDDDKKLIKCKSTHLTGVTEDSFQINALHAPIIVDENQIEKSIVTHIYKPTDKTVIQVNFKSNPNSSLDWKIYDIYSQKFENVDQYPKHESSLNFNKELNVWTAELVIHTVNINTQNNYSLDLINEYGSDWIQFEVMQIAHYPDLAHMKMEYSMAEKLNIRLEENGTGKLSISCCQLLGEIKENVKINLLLDNNGEVEILDQGILRNGSRENLFCVNWEKLSVKSNGVLKCESENQDYFGLRLPYRKELRSEIQLNSQYKPRLTDPILKQDKFQQYFIDVDRSETSVVQIKYSSSPKALADVYVNFAKNPESKSFIRISNPNAAKFEQDEMEPNGQIEINLDELKEFLQPSKQTIFKIFLKNEIGNTSFVMNVQNSMRASNQAEVLKTTSVLATSEKDLKVTESSTLSTTSEALIISTVTIEGGHDNRASPSHTTEVPSSSFTTSTARTTQAIMTTMPTSNPTPTIPSSTSQIPSSSLRTMLPRFKLSTTINQPSSTDSTSIETSYPTTTDISTVDSEIISVADSEEWMDFSDEKESTETKFTSHRSKVTTSRPWIVRSSTEVPVDIYFMDTPTPKFYKTNSPERLEWRSTVSMDEFKSFRCCIGNNSVTDLVILLDGLRISDKNFTRTGKILCAISDPKMFTAHEHNSQLKCLSFSLNNKGSKNSSETLEIGVTGKPHIMEKSPNTSIKRPFKEPFVMSIKYFSNPSARINWFVKAPNKTDVLIGDDNEFFNVTTRQIKDGITETNLTINFCSNCILENYVRIYFYLRISNDYGESVYAFDVENREADDSEYPDFSAYQSPVVISVIILLISSILALTGVYLARKNTILCFRHRSKVIYISK